MGGMAKKHFKREGTLPSNKRGYLKAAQDKFMNNPTTSTFSIKDRGFVEVENNDNRLVSLFRDKISANTQSSQGLFANIVAGVTSVVNM